MAKRLGALRAIREKCVECCGYSPKEVKLCTIPNCPLYEYRLYGTKEYRKAGEVAEDAHRQEADFAGKTP